MCITGHMCLFYPLAMFVKKKKDIFNIHYMAYSWTCLGFKPCLCNNSRHLNCGILFY